MVENDIAALVAPASQRKKSAFAAARMRECVIAVLQAKKDDTRSAIHASAHIPIRKLRALREKEALYIRQLALGGTRIITSGVLY